MPPGIGSNYPSDIFRYFWGRSAEYQPHASKNLRLMMKFDLISQEYRYDRAICRY